MPLNIPILEPPKEKQEDLKQRIRYLLLFQGFRAVSSCFCPFKKQLLPQSLEVAIRGPLSYSGSFGFSCAFLKAFLKRFFVLFPSASLPNQLLIHSYQLLFKCRDLPFATLLLCKLFGSRFCQPFWPQGCWPQTELPCRLARAPSQGDSNLRRWTNHSKNNSPTNLCMFFYSHGPKCHL